MKYLPVILSLTLTGCTTLYDGGVPILSTCSDSLWLKYSHSKGKTEFEATGLQHSGIITASGSAVGNAAGSIGAAVAGVKLAGVAGSAGTRLAGVVAPGTAVVANRNTNRATATPAPIRTH